MAQDKWYTYIMQYDWRMLMISREIKRLRKRAGISQKLLGEHLGVGQSTVAMWESGKNKPEYETLLRMAELFGVGVSELAGDGTSGFRVPVLGRVQAGLPRTAVEDVIGFEEISAEMHRSGEFFALRIRGASMEPRFVDGDTVIVRRQSSVENGEIAIVLVGDEDATCKRFYRHSEGISLVSINPQYAPMFFGAEELETTKIEVLGKVCELRARF